MKQRPPGLNWTPAHHKDQARQWDPLEGPLGPDRCAGSAGTERAGPVLNILEPPPQSPRSRGAQLVFGRRPRPEGPWQGHVQPPGLLARRSFSDLPPGRQGPWIAGPQESAPSRHLPPLLGAALSPGPPAPPLPAQKSTQASSPPGKVIAKERDSLDEPALGSQGPRARALGHEGTPPDQCSQPGPPDSPRPAQSGRLSTLTRKARGGPCHSSAHTPAGAPGSGGLSPGPPGAEGPRTRPSHHRLLPRPGILATSSLVHTHASQACTPGPRQRLPPLRRHSPPGRPRAPRCRPLSTLPCHRGPWGGASGFP